MHTCPDCGAAFDRQQHVDAHRGTARMSTMSAGLHSNARAKGTMSVRSSPLAATARHCSTLAFKYTTSGAQCLSNVRLAL